MTRAHLIGVGALLTIAALPCRGHAYSDPERFGAPADEGGGGGRYFTGSLSDGYTCAVCHSGGVAPEVVVRGLPRTGYAPDQLVEAELSFPNGPANHAVALEVVDSAGKDVGLELVPEAEIAVSERCGGTAGGKRASYLAQIGDRRVLGVEACEARAVRFRFRTKLLERITVAATVLASDNSATVKGDGVTEFDETLYRDGAAARAASASCSLLAGHAPGSSAWLWLAMLTPAWLGRSARGRARARARQRRV
jgi:hypothetical protein